MSVQYPEHQATGFALNEADTCGKHVVPKLQAAGWDNDPFSIAEQPQHYGSPHGLEIELPGAMAEKRETTADVV